MSTCGWKAFLTFLVKLLLMLMMRMKKKNWHDPFWEKVEENKLETKEEKVGNEVLLLIPGGVGGWAQMAKQYFD